MKIKTLILVGLAATVFGQPKDVTGWEKVKWGMTIAQAAKASGGVIQPKPYIHMNERILIDGSFGEAVVYSAVGSDLVSKVRVLTYPGYPGPDYTYEVRDKAYTKLRAEMVAKYGTPRKSRFYFDQWRFPSTIITLSTLTIYGEDTGPVSVVFEPNHGGKDTHR
jgi:hypothetical protein